MTSNCIIQQEGSLSQTDRAIKIQSSSVASRVQL